LQQWLHERRSILRVPYIAVLLVYVTFMRVRLSWEKRLLTLECLSVCPSVSNWKDFH